ncbi:hypothetical protein THAOC_14969 [Thalassiosira oceanica]|uniref:BspA family leucine-rich repeat surface protein n=1 Tax=Thalassiosira oceanica TaxID=159749 RepID=K0STH4_THAOC|nr:hypothetical protein THAOC_14969 [Thalassiosira oceanica]|eukprot:EJK64311.1 hypothetical protein THAOC_14969 [Thalassiosira oceanica]
MAWMFGDATAFDQPLLNFNTAAVTSMGYMFYGATAFNQPLSTFDTTKVVTMKLMFLDATAFNQDLCHFGDNFSLLSDVTSIFFNSGCSNKVEPTSETGPWCAVETCLSPTPPPVSSKHQFTTNTELRDAIKEYLGQDCPSDLNCQARSDYGGAIGEWDVSSVEDFSKLFINDFWVPIDGADTFNEALNWNTGSATEMSDMFRGASAFNQDLSAFDTSKVENVRVYSC